MGEAGAGSGRVLGCSGLFHFQRGGLAEPSVSGQCEGSLAGDAPRSLCEVGARCWGCPGDLQRGAVWERGAGPARGCGVCVAVGLGAVGSGVTAVGGGLLDAPLPVRVRPLYGSRRELGGFGCLKLVLIGLPGAGAFCTCSLLCFL